MMKKLLGGATYRLIILSPGPSNAPGCKRDNMFQERSLQTNDYLYIYNNVVDAIYIKYKIRQ